jgi:hypothetical protein
LPSSEIHASTPFIRSIFDKGRVSLLAGLGYNGFPLLLAVVRRQQALSARQKREKEGSKGVERKVLGYPGAGYD